MFDKLPNEIKEKIFKINREDAIKNKKFQVGIYKNGQSYIEIKNIEYMILNYDVITKYYNKIYRTPNKAKIKIDNNNNEYIISFNAKKLNKLKTNNIIENNLYDFCSYQKYNRKYL